MRDIFFLDDVCRLLELEIAQIGSLRSGVFNVGGDTAISLLEATRFFEKKTGHAMSITHEKTPRKADAVIYITDNWKVQRVLEWNPQVSLAEGLDSILAWIGENEKQLGSRFRPVG